MSKLIKGGIRCIFIGCTFVTLLGCVNSNKAPDTFYYVLESKPVLLTSTNKTGETQIKVNAVVIPDYMNQPNLVLKLSDHQIKLANYHFWAEDLRQSIQRVLINDLNQHHKDLSFTQQCSRCNSLSITIDHFYPTQGGDVLLSGSYEVRSTLGQLEQRGFSLKTELDEGGFDESVAKMRLLINTLAVELEL